MNVLGKQYKILLLIFSGLFFAGTYFAYAAPPTVIIRNGRINNAYLAGANAPAIPADPCAGTPAAGTLCTGGAKYAGTFDPLDGGGVQKYMTTPDDAPGGGAYVWANVNQNNATARSTTDGLANTSVLKARGEGYAAGYYCGTLSANGYSDWFLPSLGELNLLYLNRDDIGGFNVLGGWPASAYWSSTESNINNAGFQNFTNSNPSNINKSNIIRVRCVRRY